jgi:IS5 family transposase
LLKNDNQLAMLFTLANLFRADQMIRQWRDLTKNWNNALNGEETV